MATNITPDYLRGFLIPTISISKDNLWAAQSQYTQANSRAGVPEAQSDGVNLTLSSIGSQGEEITVETIQGGLPGEARFKWKGEDSTELGKDAAHILTESGYWKYSSSTAVGSYFYSDCVSDLNGSIWVISEILDSSNRYTISLRRQKQSGTIDLVETFESAILVGTPSSLGLPSITRLQDGSLLVAYFQYTSENAVNIKVHRSLDDGDTWKEISPRGLVDSIASSSNEPKKMKLVTVDNTVLLFIELETSNTNRLAQYVSRDGGTTFSLVDQISSISDGYFHQPSPVALPDGTIGVAYISDTAELNFTKIPNPGIRLSASYWTAANENTISITATTFSSITSNVMSGGNVTAFYQDGLIWVIAQEFGDGRLIGYYSEDMGSSWRYASGGTTTASNGYILDYGSNSDRLLNLSSCVHEGRAKVIAHNTNSVWSLALGGYSSFSYPARSDNPPFYQYLVWESTYIPVMLPATSSQYSTTGTGTQALDDEGLNITTSGNVRSYRYLHSGGYFDEGQVIRLRLQVDQGTSVLSDHIAIKITQDDTTNSTELQLRFSTTTIQVRDSAGVKATISHDMTASTEIVIGLFDTDAEIYYRTADGAQAKKWNLQSITGITKGASGAGNAVEWGHFSFSGVLTFESHWQEVSITSGEQAGLGKFTLRGAKYPPLGEYQYIDQGLAITAKDSPARGEDQYKITPRYDYAIENIFHGVSLSPRVTWRSTGDATQARIPLFIDPVVQATEKNLGLSDVLGVHLANVNFRKFSLQSWDGAAWSVLADVDIGEGFNGTYIKKGNTLISNNTGKNFLLRYGEAIGWRAELKSGETTKIVKIRMNSEGIWTNNNSVKQTVLQYDTSLTDPSTIPASGTIHLIPDSITFIKSRLDGVNLGQYALAIEIPVQETLEGYFQIGSLLMGSVAFPAPQYQRGRSITFSPNIQAQETLDGMFFSRKMSAGRRTASIAWTEPIDTTRLNELDPDYWQISQSSGAQPIANYGDPYLMHGIFRYLSNREPLVYLPSIDVAAFRTGLDGENEAILNRREQHMLARTTGEVTVESVIGEEMIDEMFRVATVNLEEIE